MIHTVKGLGIVKKAEIDVFLELSCFFHDPADVGNLISGSFGTAEDEMAGWHHGLDGCEFSEFWELVMEREALRAAIHGVAKSRTRLSD